MRIRGEEVALACSMVGGYPRPHWLQGRVFGSLHEPLYRSTAIRVAYEDAVRLCAQDQERAGLDILADGQQYFDWETPGMQLEPIFHYITEMLEGFQPWGPPNPVPKYAAFYMADCVGEIRRVRSLFDGVLVAMQGATAKPFKISLGFIDVKDTNVESPEKVAGNIKRVLEAEIVPPERLFVMPDCGLGYCSRSVAAGKLRAMGEGVRMAREGL